MTVDVLIYYDCCKSKRAREKEDQHWAPRINSMSFYTWLVYFALAGAAEVCGQRPVAVQQRQGTHQPSGSARRLRPVQSASGPRRQRPSQAGVFGCWSVVLGFLMANTLAKTSCRKREGRNIFVFVWFITGGALFHFRTRYSQLLIIFLILCELDYRLWGLSFLSLPSFIKITLNKFFLSMLW